MDDVLRSSAAGILERLPVSLEMPAGTGKTQLVAAMAAVAAGDGRKTLVLTHTHAGVDAIRRRLKAFGVVNRDVHIDTITGWAFDLVRSYPLLAEVAVPETPVWSNSRDYLEGAIRVARATAIREMHAASFDYFIIDEYQDCSELQHQFVLAISEGIPGACALGDRLQGIFEFGGERLVNWENDVFPNFPLHVQEHEAWRWKGHNEPLGDWLLDVRPSLLAGQALNISAVNIPGLAWFASGVEQVSGLALKHRPDGESVLLLGQWTGDVDELGRNLRGVYGVMEELQGKFMVKFLESVEAAEPSAYAYLVAKFAKDCLSGLRGLDSRVLNRLENASTVSHLKRPGLESVLAVLDLLLLEPSIASISTAMSTIHAAPGVRLFKREAWFDTRKAIDMASSNDDLSTVQAIGRIRDVLRHTGRTSGQHGSAARIGDRL